MILTKKNYLSFEMVEVWKFDKTQNCEALVDNWFKQRRTCLDLNSKHFGLKF